MIRHPRRSLSCLVALLVGLVCGSPVDGTALAAGPSTTVRVPRKDHAGAMAAEMQLRAGRFHRAVGAAQTCLQADPDALECTAVLLRAQAALGACDEVSALAGPLRPTEGWTFRTATAEGLCHLRTGDLSQAMVAFEEAERLQDKSPLPVFQQGMVAVRLRDPDTARARAETLWLHPQGDWMARILEGWIALLSGGEVADAAIAQFQAVHHVEDNAGVWVQYGLLDCQRWLDVGDPRMAASSAKLQLRHALRQSRLLACRAEALRRAGEAEAAWEVAHRPWNASVDGYLLDLISIRIAVDRGDLDEARALAAKVGTVGGEDALATRWYLARALGDGSAADAAASAYHALTRPEGRDLQDLLVVGASE